MKASKFIVSTLAAGSVVAAVGFAYAQTAPTPADPSYQTPQTQTQTQTQPDPMRSNQPMPADQNSQMQRPIDSTTRTDSMNNPSTTFIDNSTMESERMARADRN